MLPLGSTTVTPLPSAAESGLILPSEQCPMELELLATPLDVTFATAITPSASAGAVMIRHDGMLPSLPALATTMMPRSAAHWAARDTTAVLPSICAVV